MEISYTMIALILSVSFFLKSFLARFATLPPSFAAFLFSSIPIASSCSAIWQVESSASAVKSIQLLTYGYASFVISTLLN